MNINLIDNYLDEIHRMYISGDAREESYYSILERFLLSVAADAGLYPRVIIMPKTKEPQNPDFLIRDSGGNSIGYIEAKIPGTDLDVSENDSQIDGYIERYCNFLLTDFLEFRFFRFHKDGRVFRLGKADPGGIIPTDCYKELFLTDLLEFISRAYPQVITPKEMAEFLADRTRFIKDSVVMPELIKESGDNDNASDKTNYIKGFYHAFQLYLSHGLSPEEFADIYSQTLTYSLFMASYESPVQLDRSSIARHIPQGNGILRDMFEFFSSGNISPALTSCMNDILNKLNTIDRQRYYYQTFPEDPVIHFYETFLAKYDPRIREKRGVYYTPEALVNFIVRSVHVLLQEKLGIEHGLAEEGINVLDPAAGTGAFLAAAVKVAEAQYEEYFGRGGCAQFARHFALHNLFGFEAMIAPYAIGHLKMLKVLHMMDVHIKPDERLNLYLTNTLDMEETEQSDLPGMSSLSRESRLAGKIKKEVPVTVIIGNPPYSGHSCNRSEKWIFQDKPGKRNGKIRVKTWIGEKIEDYKKIGGERLDERNLKWLQDDYVKFFRFAQDKIERNGRGIVGYITNHAFLDNPTFRGMRRSLMDTFDEIYVMDLHGNVSRKEKCPDGSKDENVFDIRQGVAITFLVKRVLGSGEKRPPCRVFHCHMWGLRIEKYDTLIFKDYSNFQWLEVFPRHDFYLFTPPPRRTVRGSGKSLDEMYVSFYKVTDIFPVHSVGIVTARDALTIRDTPDEAFETASTFANLKPAQAARKFKLRTDTRDWKVKLAQKDVRDSGMDRKKVIPILYRPFDTRYTYYTGNSRGFHCMPRGDVMKHMLGGNIGLVTVRQVAEGTFNHSLVTRTVIESRLTTSNKGMAFLFPLYLYPYLQPQYHPAGSVTGLLTDGNRDLGKNVLEQPNINPRILRYAETMQGEHNASIHLPSVIQQVFYYVYGILSCPTYREIFEHALRIDFPRIPLTNDFLLFHQMAVLGEQLTHLHLLEFKDNRDWAAKFEIEGDNTVVKGGFVPSQTVAGKDGKEEAVIGNVFINNRQYFSRVPLPVWDFCMGGYKVLDKWLKDRRGHILSHRDISRFIKIIESLRQTVRYQEKTVPVFDKILETAKM